MKFWGHVFSRKNVFFCELFIFSHSNNHNVINRNSRYIIFDVCMPSAHYWLFDCFAFDPIVWNSIRTTVMIQIWSSIMPSAQITIWTCDESFLIIIVRITVLAKILIRAAASCRVRSHDITEKHSMRILRFRSTSISRARWEFFLA